MDARARYACIGAALFGLAIAVGIGPFATRQLRRALRRGVRVEVVRPIPVRASIERPLDVSIDQELVATVRLSELTIPIADTIELPLRMGIDLPIDTEFAINQDVDVGMNVPIDVVLTERELDLSGIEVPIDSQSGAPGHCDHRASWSRTG